MNQLPSERIQEIQDQLRAESEVSGYMRGDLLLSDAILVYLDEEYEKLQDEIRNLKDHVRSLEHDVWPEGWDFIE